MNRSTWVVAVLAAGSTLGCWGSDAAPGPDAAGGDGGTGDDQPPAVVLEAPVAGTTVCGRVEVRASATDDRGVAHVVFTLDEAQLSDDWAPPFLTAFDTWTVADGAHTLRAVAHDGAGQTAVAEAAVTVDSGAAGCSVLPQVSFTYPTDGARVRSGTYAEVTVTSVAGVERVRFELDGAYLGEDTDAPFVTYLSFPDDGPHVLRATAVAPGGAEGFAELDLVADDTPPVVAFVAPVADSLHATDFTVSFTAVDAGPVVEATLSGPALGWVTFASPPYAAIWSVSNMCGAVELQASATDEAGNVGSVTVAFWSTTQICDADCDGHRSTGGACGGDDCDDRNPYVRDTAWERAVYPVTGAHSAIAVAPGDVAHLAYTDDVQGRLLYQAGASPAVALATDPDGAGPSFADLELVLDAAAHAHLLYRRLIPGGEGLRYATNASGAWVTEDVVVGPNLTSSDLVVDGAGVPRVVYYDDTSRILRLAERTGPATWSTSVVAGSAGDHVGFDCDLAIDAADMLHLVYGADVVGGSTVNALLYRRRPAGGAWSAPETIASPRGTGPSMQVRGSGASREVRASYARGGAVFLARKSGDAALTTEYVFPGVGPTRLAMDGAGAAHIVTLEGSATRWSHLFAGEPWWWAEWEFDEDVDPTGGLADLTTDSADLPWIVYQSRRSSVLELRTVHLHTCP